VKKIVKAAGIRTDLSFVMVAFYRHGIARIATAGPGASYFVGAVNALAQGRLVPVPGGVLIMDGTTLLGAVGVSGDTSDNDETCAIAGIEAV
jgi:uncharacterized protein GlcG (DUF336 family)